MGGKRVGAGRKKGSTTKAKAALTAEIRARVKNAKGKLPLDIMLEAIGIVYRDKRKHPDTGEPMGGALAAFAMAERAAPYLHPKLSSVDANVKGELIIEVMRFTGAT
jgi:hypothetical protein